VEQDAGGLAIALIGSVAGVVGAVAAVMQLRQHRKEKIHHADTPQGAASATGASIPQRHDRYRLSLWDRITLAATDPDDVAAGMVSVSLIPAFFELVGWLVLMWTDTQPGTATAWAVMALPIFLATLVGALSVIQFLVTIGEGFVRSFVALAAVMLCAAVIITSLDLVGALRLSTP